MSVIINEIIIAHHGNNKIIEYQLIANNGFQVNILNYGGEVNSTE